MPVITQSQSAYTLMSVAADMDAGRIFAKLRWTVDGRECGVIEVEAIGEEFLSVLSAVPDGIKTRADDIADMVYQLALGKGLVSGTIA